MWNVLPANVVKSMITSARSATPSATAGTCTGVGSRFPSLEICQNMFVIVGLPRSVRYSWTKREGPVLSQRKR